MKSHILYSLKGWVSPFVIYSALVIASATHLLLMSVKNTILAGNLGLASVRCYVRLLVPESCPRVSKSGNMTFPLRYLPHSQFYKPSAVCTAHY
jgi:hypothetical protein